MHRRFCLKLRYSARFIHSVTKCSCAQWSFRLNVNSTSRLCRMHIFLQTSRETRSGKGKGKQTPTPAVDTDTEVEEIEVQW